MRKRLVTVLLAGLACGSSLLAEARLDEVTVRARTGFDLSQPFVPLEPDDAGVRAVRLPDALGRLEMVFSAPLTAAHLLVNGELRPAPVGASVVGDRFAWAPPVGYVGTYTLRFVIGPSVVDVVVSLVPVRRPEPGESEVRMHLDSVDATPCGLGAGACARVVGWALDPQAGIGAGIEAVHVWASRSESAPVFLGVADLGAARPDVARAFGAAFGKAGFSLQSSVTLAPGAWSITAYVWNTRTNRWEDARTGSLIVR